MLVMEKNLCAKVPFSSFFSSDAPEELTSKNVPANSQLKNNVPDQKTNEDLSKNVNFEIINPHDDSNKELNHEIISENIVSIENSEKQQNFHAWNWSMKPWNFNGDENGAIMLNFASADLEKVLKFFEETYGVIFITDDAVQPTPQGGKSLAGNKVNFTTNRPVSRKEAWNILITLLETVGLTIQPGSMERTYRVSTLQLPKNSPLSYCKNPLPFYMGVDIEELPEADMRIRYIYRVKNTSLETVKNIIIAMQSAFSPEPIEIPDISSILITDRVYNIKSMLAVIYELDRSTLPEMMSIIKLNKADATKVCELYKTLMKDESNNPGRVLGPRRSDTISYFDPNIRVFPEPRTNSIIIFGPAESIEKLEKFIKDFEDQDTRVPYIPTFTYKLKHTHAESVAKILEAAIDFKSDTEVGKFGGIRNGDKYFSRVIIVAEPTTNALLISAPEDEFWHIHKLLEEIDVEQPQVALDVMMVNINLGKNKGLASQIRNSQGQLGNNVNFQTGLYDSTGIVGNYNNTGSGNTMNNGNTRLLGNLIELITGNAQSAGTTLLTLGSDPNGVWGILKILQSHTRAEVINNPFIVTTNNYEAIINAGEVRRIPATAIINDNYQSQSFASDDARIQVRITPQISGEGLITLNIGIENSQFTSPSGNTIESGNKVSNTLNTSLIVQNGEIIAIGGLNQESIIESEKAVPFLSKIPIIGTFFKTTQQQKTRSSLVIFIRSQVIPPSTKSSNEDIGNINQKSKQYFENQINKRNFCPVNRWFFADPDDQKHSLACLENFMKPYNQETASLPIKKDEENNIQDKEEIHA